MAFHEYNAAEVIVTWAGIPIDGPADGTFLSVEWNEDQYQTYVGTTGDVTRSKTNNNTARATVTVAQSSAANDLLSAAHALGVIGPIYISDGSGRSLFTSENAWIIKYPTSEFGREVSDREWIIECDDLIAFIGGN